MNAHLNTRTTRFESFTVLPRRHFGLNSYPIDRISFTPTQLLPPHVPCRRGPSLTCLCLKPGYESHEDPNSSDDSIAASSVHTSSNNSVHSDVCRLDRPTYDGSLDTQNLIAATHAEFADSDSDSCTVVPSANGTVPAFAYRTEKKETIRKWEKLEHSPPTPKKAPKSPDTGSPTFSVKLERLDSAYQRKRAFVEELPASPALSTISISTTSTRRFRKPGPIWKVKRESPKQETAAE